MTPPVAEVWIGVSKQIDGARIALERQWKEKAKLLSAQIDALKDQLEESEELLGEAKELWQKEINTGSELWQRFNRLNTQIMSLIPPIEQEVSKLHRESCNASRID